MQAADSASRSDKNPDHTAPGERQFVLRRLVFAVLLSTSVALVIGLASGSRVAFWHSLVVSHCVALSIFAFATVVRLTIFRRFNLRRPTRTITYLLTYPAGMVFGGMLGYMLIADPTVEGREYTHYGWQVSLAFGVLTCAIAIVYNMTVSTLSERQRQLEIAERAGIEAQLRTLQAQIEPHFLFNTLANLDALIAVDPDEARSMLAHLIRYLRAALTHARSERATLQTEVELLQAYLNIMALRLPNRLTAEFDCEPETLAMTVPPMLLQPLVENAITHGIEPSPKGGVIRVTTRVAHDTLQLVVRDTGVGLDHPAAKHGTGAGIANVRQRLRSLFGEDARITLEPVTPGGTQATILIPLQALR